MIFGERKFRFCLLGAIRLFCFLCTWRSREIFEKWKKEQFRYEGVHRVETAGKNVEKLVEYVNTQRIQTSFPQKNAILIWKTRKIL